MWLCYRKLQNPIREKHNATDSEINRVRSVTNKHIIPVPEPDSIPDSSCPGSSSAEAGSIPDESPPEADATQHKLGKIKLRVTDNQQYIKAMIEKPFKLFP